MVDPSLSTVHIKVIFKPFCPKFQIQNLTIDQNIHNSFLSPSQLPVPSAETAEIAQIPWSQALTNTLQSHTHRPGKVIFVKHKPYFVLPVLSTIRVIGTALHDLLSAWFFDLTFFFFLNSYISSLPNRHAGFMAEP